MVRPANDGLRFFLELSALAAVAYWGWSEHDGALRWVLVVATPLAIALVWGRWVAPKAKHPAVDPARLGLEVLVFGSAVAASWIRTNSSRRRSSASPPRCTSR